MNNFANNKVVIGVAGLVIGLVLGWLIGRDGAMMTNDKSEQANTESQETINMTASAGNALSSNSTMGEESKSAILVVDQGAGSVVTVASVETDANSWVAVREDNNGVIGNILGAVPIDAGDSKNVVVRLLRATQPNKTYRVVLFRDNGDNMFDYKVDKPMTENGVLISQSFKTVAQ